MDSSEKVNWNTRSLKKREGNVYRSQRSERQKRIREEDGPYGKVEKPDRLRMSRKF